MRRQGGAHARAVPPRLVNESKTGDANVPGVRHREDADDVVTGVATSAPVAVLLLRRNGHLDPGVLPRPGVGAVLGAGVGVDVADGVGWAVADGVGVDVPDTVGSAVGDGVGAAVGGAVGVTVGVSASGFAADAGVAVAVGAGTTACPWGADMVLVPAVELACPANATMGLTTMPPMASKAEAADTGMSFIRLSFLRFPTVGRQGNL